MTENKPTSTEITPVEDAEKIKDTGKTEKKPAEKPKQKKQTSFSFSSFIQLVFIIIIISAAAGAFYYWQQLQQNFVQINSATQQNESQLSALTSSIDQQQRESRELSNTINDIRSVVAQDNAAIEQLNQRQQDLTETANQLFSLTNRDQRQWLLAEVSYLLSLANQRLLIARDINAAIAALNSANNRLHDLADPTLIPLRQQIADETTALKSIKQPDISGMVISIDGLLSLVSELPIKTPQQQSAAEQPQSETIELQPVSEDSFFAPLWNRIKGLFTIRKHNRQIEQTQTAFDQQKIDNSLRHRLEIIRLAVLKQDQNLFNHEIQQTINELEFYYQNDDNRVQGLLDDLNTLKAVTLMPELPNITESWSMLQRAMATTSIELETSRPQN